MVWAVCIDTTVLEISKQPYNGVYQTCPYLHLPSNVMWLQLLVFSNISPVQGASPRAPWIQEVPRSWAGMSAGCEMLFWISKRRKKYPPQYWHLHIVPNPTFCPRRASKLYYTLWVCGLVLKEPHAEEVGLACIKKQKVQELTLANASQGKVIWGIGCHCQVRAWSQRVQLHKNTAIAHQMQLWPKTMLTKYPPSEVMLK